MIGTTHSSGTAAHLDEEKHSVVARFVLALTAGQQHLRLLSAVCFISLAIMTGLLIWIGAARTFIFGHDIFAMLDGGWRVLNGQRPYADFYSGFGPFPFLLFGAGLKLSGGNVQGIGYMNAILAVALGLSCWMICRPRMFPIPAILAAIAVPLIAVAPFPLGQHANELSYAMSYNRHGYALLALILLESWQSTESERNEIIGALLAGSAAAITLFQKANFFGIAAALLVISVLFRRSKLRITALTTGFALTVVAFLAYLRFNVAGMAWELTTVAHAREATVSTYFLRWMVLGVLANAVLVLVLAALLTHGPERSTGPVERWRIGLGAIVIIGSDIVLLMSNTEKFVLPLTSMFVLVMFNEMLLRMRASPQSLWYYTGPALIALAIFAPDILSNGSGVLYGATMNLRPLPATVEQIHSPSLAKLVLYDYTGPNHDFFDRSNGRQYTHYLNEGIDLLKRYSKPTDKITTLDQFNPFPFALHRPPPHGGAIAMGFGNNFTAAHGPSPQFYLGDADVLMSPTHPSAPDGTIHALQQIYGSAVAHNFRLCAESAYWRLYKRPGALAGCPDSLSN